MSEFEKQPWFYKEPSPNEIRPGEIAESYVYMDDKNSKKLVRFYVNRNGKSYLLPGEPREATEEEINDFEKRRKTDHGKDFELPKAA